MCTRCGVGVFGRTGHPLLIPSGGLDFVGLDVIAYTSYLCMSTRPNVQAASKAALFSVVKPLATRGFDPFPSYHMIKNARERFAQGWFSLTSFIGRKQTLGHRSRSLRRRLREAPLAKRGVHPLLLLL